MMNKYEEALDNIGSLYMYDEDGEADCMLSESFMKDDYDILKELVEKETPKKPYYEGDGYSDGELVYDTWICPNCGKSYEVDYEEYERCPHCGQKIEWSE